jgi:cytochrome c
MGNLEFNKIFAALLVAGIVAMLSGFIADKFIHPEMPEKDAVPIEGVEGPVSKSGGQKEPRPEPILAMIRDADPGKGKNIARACATCHSFKKGGAHGVGPNLWGVVGGKKQAKNGFNYSGALDKKGGDVWTYAELNKYLFNPKWYAPGTKMNYVGLEDPADRAALIAWLRTKADEKEPLPTSKQIKAEKQDLAPPEKKKDKEGKTNSGDKEDKKAQSSE